MVFYFQELIFSDIIQKNKSNKQLVLRILRFG